MKKQTPAWLQYLKKNLLFILLVLAAFCMAALYAMPEKQCADFFAINGDFQNFNVVRRILDGQAPYHDFPVYLGLGHALLGSLACFLLGFGHPTLETECWAFHVLPSLAFTATAYVLFRAVLRNRKKEWSMFFADLLLFLLTWSPAIFTGFLAIYQSFLYALQEALSNGNSARMVRGFAPVLFVAGAALCFHLLERIPALKRRSLSAPVGMGLCTGMIILYSNDFGIASAICSVLIFGFLTLIRRDSARRKLRDLGIFAAAAAAAFFAVILLATHGHPMSYFAQNAGSGPAQLWYYSSPKSHYLYDIDTSFLILLQLFAALVYLFFLFRARLSAKSVFRFGVPCFMNLTCYAAANEYKLLSGGMLHGMALTVLYLTLLAEAVGLIFMLAEKIPGAAKVLSARKAGWLAFGLVTVYCISMAVPHAIALMQGTFYRGDYVLNVGHLNSQGYDVRKANALMGEDDQVWSTYASAVETSRGQFQPSGYDYIIHVLGDKARQTYVQRFHEADTAYAATIRDNYGGWEQWARNVNWFFYRELYQNYVPSFSTGYQLFWQKRPQPLEEQYVPCTVLLEQPQADSWCISVVPEDLTLNGIIEVELSYQVHNTNPLVFNPMIWVENTSFAALEGADNTGAGYYLPPRADHLKVPVTIVNGFGQIVLDSRPAADTVLTDVTAEAGQYFCDGVMDTVLAESFFVDGETARVYCMNTQKDALLLQQAGEVCIDGIWHPIQPGAAEDDSLYFDFLDWMPSPEEQEFFLTYNALKIR